MHIQGMRGLSAKHFGTTRKDGNPKTLQEVMRDVEAILKNAQRMAEDTYRLQLETMKIETNTARIAAGLSHDNLLAGFERDMKAFAEFGRVAKANADAQTAGASSKVENRPPTGAPPIPKALSPFPAGHGLDTNLNGSGFVPSRGVVSKPSVSKLRR